MFTRKKKALHEKALELNSSQSLEFLSARLSIEADERFERQKQVFITTHLLFKVKTKKNVEALIEKLFC